MSARSIRYRELQKSIREIRGALLPTKFSATGVYRSQKRFHLRSAAFRVLAHAEIETYLEDRAEEIFNHATARWDQNASPSITVIALLAFSGKTTHKPPSTLGHANKEQKSYQTASDPIKTARTAWKKTHQANHGIKEPNVLRLFLPLGMTAADIDTTLLADLSSYGTSRGAVAHGSSTSITSYLDPKSEHDAAQSLVAKLRSFDELVNSLLNI